MADRQTDFSVGIGGDGSELLAALAKIKGEVRNAATELERTTANVTLFKGANKSLDEAADALKRAETSAKDLRRQIDALREGGQEVGKGLTKGLKDADREVSRATRALDAQQKAVAKLGDSLAKSGVNVARLADEEKRLARETAAAAKAQAEQQARQALGVKSAKETSDAIAKLNAAYATLKASGASTKELADAQSALLTKTRELREEQGGLGQSFAGLRAGVLGAAAAIATAVATMREVIELGRQFEKQTALLGSVSNASGADIRELANGVRRLSAELGVGLDDALKAAYDLLRQGVPEGNILEVLATANQAATAGVTDLGSAAKLAGTLMRGFGLDLEGAKLAMDQAFAASKNGGATIAELADSLGNIAPLARRLRIPFEEIAAAVQVMTKAGLDAPTALAQLQQIIVRLGDAKALAQLKQLGVESKGLIGTLQQLADRRLGVDEILELGVGSTRAANGVAALTQSSRALGRALETVQQSSGALAKVGADLDRLNAESVGRVSASVKSLATNIGAAVLPSASFNDALAAMIQSVDGLLTKVRDAGGSRGLGAWVTGLAASLPAVGGLASQFNLVVQSLGLFSAAQERARTELSATTIAAQAASQSLSASLGSVAAAIQAQIAAADLKIGQLRASLQALVPELQANAKAVQDAAAAGINAINQQAQARLAALDTLTNSERQIAAETLAIQQQFAADRLKVLNDSSAQVLAAAEAEAQARIGLARSTGRDVAKAEQDASASRATTLRGLIGGYQAYLTELLNLETAHQNKVKALQEGRVAVNQNIEAQIRELRSQGLSEYDRYYARVREIDDNISKSRQALAAGDLKAAQDYAAKAVEATSQISKRVEQDGRVVVSQFTAQELAVSKLKSAQELLNKVYDERIDSETKSAAATQKNIATATEQLGELKRQLDAINATVGEGIQVKLSADAAKVRETLDALAKETAQRELLLGLSLKVDEAKDKVSAIKSDLEAGLTVEAQVKLDQVQAAIATIAEAKPELVVQTAEAQRAIGDLSTQIAQIAADPVAITATVNSNVAEVQAAIDNLQKPTFSTHTVTVRTVEAKAAGGLIGEQAAAIRRNWPAARGAVQQFARGGAVFRRPAWSKVPGVGSGDTVPAALQSGSFVVRKAASRYYGDGLMRMLSSRPQGYALGGLVGVLPLLQGRISDIVQHALGGLRGGGSGRQVEGVDYQGLVQMLTTIVEATRDLVPSSTGLDVSKWAGALLERMPYLSDDKLRTLADAIRENFKGILDGAKTARNFGVPNVVGDDLLGWLFLNRGGHARGGDTVPAMLTPGEFVVNRSRVQQLGDGFMHAVNSMRFSRESLAAMLRGPAAPRVRYFEDGGSVVASAGGAPSSPPAASGGAGVINVSVTAAPGALLSAENVRRFIVPVLEDTMRRRAN